MASNASTVLPTHTPNNNIETPDSASLCTKGESLKGNANNNSPLVYSDLYLRHTTVAVTGSLYSTHKARVVLYGPL